MHKDCQKTDVVTCRQMYPEVRKVWFALRPPGLGMQITGCGLTKGTLDERSLFFFGLN